MHPTAVCQGAGIAVARGHHALVPLVMRRENNDEQDVAVQEVVELDGDGDDAKEGCGIDHHDSVIPTYHPT